MLLVLACVIMYLVEMVISPVYIVKSIIKIIVFLGAVFAFRLLSRQPTLKGLFNINSKKEGVAAAVMGVLVVAAIFIGYYVCSGLIDVNTVVGGLSRKENISRDNFIFVAVYICFVNSFLEEMLFRGLGFMVLKKYMKFWIANTFSAIIFSAYHVAIIGSWFSFEVFVLIIIGLALCGLLFNALDNRYNSIFPSWIVHLSANIAINIIGYMMLTTV